jgi:membrane glycosyltransferase
MGFGDRDANGLEFTTVAAELVRAGGRRQSIEHVSGQKFGCRIMAFELRRFVEVLVVERRKKRLQRLVRATDIDDNPIGAQAIGQEGGVDDEGRAMERLRRAEHFAAERMSDHDVIANFNCEQGSVLSRCRGVFAVGISNQGTNRAVTLGENRWQARWKVIESDRRSGQRIEPRIQQKPERSGEPALRRPAGPMRGRDTADLAGNEAQPARMEGAAEWRRDVASAVPAEFEYGRLFARQPDRGRQTGACCAGVDDKIAIAWRVGGRCEFHAERARQQRSRWLNVDQCRLDAGKTAAEIGDQRANNAGADDGDSIGGRRRGVPNGVERGLHIGRERCARERQTVRQQGDSLSGEIEDGLVRMKRKDRAVAPFGRSAFNAPDGRIAVFDRKRKRAAHERRTHAREFRLGHATGDHQSFRAAADGAVAGANPDFARSGRVEPLATDFGAIRSDIPKRVSIHRLIFPRRLAGWTYAWTCSTISDEPGKAQGTAAMLDRPTAPVVSLAIARVTLARRRALFSTMVSVSIVGLLWLAADAVPPRSPAAVAFLAFFAITLPWSTIGFWNACIGFAIMRCARDPVATVNPLAASARGGEPIVASTAILVCIRNEIPAQICRNLQPLLDGLASARIASRFRVYLLSDTGDSQLALAEETCFKAFIESWRDEVDIIYRRRLSNAGFKAGNIRDFCEQWGADHELAITFDADSFMPAEAVVRIVRIMQANPTLGILQTLSIGMPSMSAFARLFQFGMRLGMHSHTLGAAWWQGDCGPYWGHNAIIRLKPFIDHCGMPILPPGGPLGGHILSHDQVEAALMRRAGFEVRVLPIEGMSWEENPPTLLEFIRRDLRWCQGNMQYWQLLAMPGLKPVSRFQLVFAILMYLGSPAWMTLLAIGALTLLLSDAPAAPVARNGPGAALFAITLFMIFAPKLATSLDALARRSLRRRYGGAGRFLLNVAAETIFSILLSPIMAFAHTLFLFRLFGLGRGGTWNSQTRESHAVAWKLAWTKLWPQTAVGLAMLGIVAMKAPHAIGFGLMGLGGLALSIPFAVATASPWVGGMFVRLGLGRVPEEMESPAALASLHLPAIACAAAMREPR